MATGGKNVSFGITIGANATAALSAFAALKRTIEQKSQALQAARAEATRLAKALKDTDTPSPALVKSFEEAKQKAAALKQEVSQGQQQLEGMRRSLAGAGIDTKNLAESMRRVAQEAKAAKEAQQQAQKLTDARKTLDVKPHTEITAQINQAKEAYAQLKASGTLTAAELGQAYAKLQVKLNELRGQTNGWAEGLGRVRESAVALMGALAGWAGAVKLAANFEAAMVDFARATNQTKAEVMGLADGFRDLAQKYGLGADAIAEIATVGGKLGVAREDLNQFVEAVAKAAVNFDMLPQEAAKAMAMLSSLLKIPVAQLESFAGAINAVADGVGVMERDIINALARAGSSAQELGLSRNQAVAMAAALIKLGADAESAGSAIRTFSSRLRFAINDQGQAGASLKRLVGDVRGFAQLLYTDGQAAVNQFFAALNRMPGPERFAVLKDIFQEGLDTENINKLATGTETYARALKAATGDAQSFSSALERLTQMKLGTTQSEFAQLAQAVRNLGDVFGQLVLPAVRLVTVGLNGVATALRAWVQAMPVTAALVGALVTVAAGAAALRLGLGAVALLWGKLATAGAAAVSALLGPLAAWVGRTAALQAAKVGLGVALRSLLGPIGLVIAAVELGVFAWDKWGQKSKEATDAAQAHLKATAASARQEMGQVAQAVDAAASVVSDRLMAANERAKTSAESLPESYKRVAQGVNDAYSRTTQAIDATLKQQLASVKGNALAEVQVVVNAELEKQIAAERAATEKLAAWQATYQSIAASGAKWVQDEAQRSQQVAQLDRQALSERLAIFSQLETAYRQTVDKLIAEEERHLGEVRRIEQERLNVKLSVQDRIRELGRKGMDEAAAFTDRQRQIEEKQAAARAAIAQGQYELGKRFAEESMSLAERNAVAVKQNGQEVVTQAQASAEAVARMKESAGLVDEALKRMAQGHANAATAARTGADGAKQALADVSKEVDALQAKLSKKMDVALAVDVEKFQSSLAEIEALVKAKALLMAVKADMAEVDAALAQAQEKGRAGVDLKVLAKVEGLSDALTQAQTGLDAANINVPLKFDRATVLLKDFAQAAKLTLEQPTQSTHRIDSNAEQARQDIDSLNKRDTQSTHTVYVRQVEQRANGGLVGAVARFAQGGQVLGQAWRSISGRVFGPGTGTSDSVPAMLSAGEFVVKSDRVRQYGVRLLQAINSGRFAYDPNPTHLTAALTMARDVQRESADAETTLRLLDTVEGPIRLTSTRDEAQKLVRVLQKAGVRFA